MTLMHRRSFLTAVAGGLATLDVSASSASTQLAQHSARIEDSAALKVVDFHNHYVGAKFTPIAGATAPAAARPYFDRVNRNLADSGALLASIEQAGVAARVVNTPLEFLQGPDENAPSGLVERINDQLAELVTRHPGRLYGLATVDAYGGEAAARELTRAVRELGLRGVFVASAKKDLFLDSAHARPTLAAAAELGIPVFAHPITDDQLSERLGKYGRPGVTLNRGTVNSAALVALVESGLFGELPRLRVVVTTLAIGGVLLTAGFGEGKVQQDPMLLRRHIYIDTMRMDPMLMRAAIAALGVEHVLAGTDWPIFTETNVPQRLRTAMIACGLGSAEQQMIASGNTLKLLGAT